MPAVRYRRCPNCQVVRPASAFRHAPGPTFAPAELLRRRCPGGDPVAPLMSFTIAERPEAPNGHRSGGRGHGGGVGLAQSPGIPGGDHRLVRGGRRWVDWATV